MGAQLFINVDFLRIFFLASGNVICIIRDHRLPMGSGQWTRPGPQIGDSGPFWPFCFLWAGQPWRVSGDETHTDFCFGTL